MALHRVVGINFDHMHMGDLLHQVRDHPEAEIAGICDEDAERVAAAGAALGIPADRIYTDYRVCLGETAPDLAILCPATAEHALWVERVAPHAVNVLLEKPFAASLAEADRMIAAMAATGKLFAINWPLAWYPPHVTSKRVIDEGTIGEVIEIHYYDGNRGPLWHTAEKIALEPTAERKAASWFYREEKGGGSLLDYLGYGATLGTWFYGGQAPLSVTSVVDTPAGLGVDEHSVTVARYERGLSKFETRWGTFTDPWTWQPQPRCGFVIVGTDGTISSYDYDSTIRVQSRAHPEGEVIAVDALQAPFQDPVQYVLHCLDTGTPVQGPLSVEISRVGQQIVESARQSAREGRTVPLAQ